MTSRPSDTQEQPVEPKADATEAALNEEALDQVMASGAYPLPRGNYCTGPTG